MSLYFRDYLDLPSPSEDAKYPLDQEFSRGVTSHKSVDDLPLERDTTTLLAYPSDCEALPPIRVRSCSISRSIWDFDSILPQISHVGGCICVLFILSSIFFAMYMILVELPWESIYFLAIRPSSIPISGALPHITPLNTRSLPRISPVLACFTLCCLALAFVNYVLTVTTNPSSTASGLIFRYPFNLLHAGTGITTGNGHNTHTQAIIPSQAPQHTHTNTRTSNPADGKVPLAVLAAHESPNHHHQPYPPQQRQQHEHLLIPIPVPAPVPVPVPGSLPAPVQRQERWCRKCEAFKSPRTHHCSACGRCIVRMDHHCPWVANCIGLYNYRHFMLLLLYTCLASMPLTYYCVQSLFFCTSINGSNAMDINLPEETTPHPVVIPQTCPGMEDFNMVILLFLSSVAAIAVTILFCFHVYLLLTNQTTLECLGAGRHAYDNSRHESLESSSPTRTAINATNTSTIHRSMCTEFNNTGTGMGKGVALSPKGVGDDVTEITGTGTIMRTGISTDVAVDMARSAEYECRDSIFHVSPLESRANRLIFHVSSTLDDIVHHYSRPRNNPYRKSTRYNVESTMGKGPWWWWLLPRLGHREEVYEMLVRAERDVTGE